MDNIGYIKLHRSLLDSEIFASEKGLKIWIWILLKANYKEKFIPLKIGKGQSTIKIKRGQFLFGRFTAEEELNINGSTIYKWIKKMETMEMIELESNNHYTIVTVCNYNDYNKYNEESSSQVAANEQPTNSQVTANEQPSNTTNKDNKDNKEKNDKNNYISFVDWFNDSFNRKFKALDKLIPKFKKALQDFTFEEIKTASTNAHNDKFHNESGYKYLTLEYILRPDKIDKYLNFENKPQPQQEKINDYSIDDID